MSYINCKYLWAVALVAVLVITGTEIRIGRTQTNSQTVEYRVEELERKLADAKARQEKAQSIQKQLQEQEQKLAGLEKYLSESDKYRVQVIEIRMGIKSIRAKIEAIVKEKDDLEQNLILAKNLQTMLRQSQSIPKIEATDKANSDSVKTNYWKINNVHISNHFVNEERDEIMRVFSSGSQLNQDDFLNGAHKIYNITGTTIHFIIHQKAENNADLDIVLNRRARLNFTHGNIFQTQNISEFKANHFGLEIVND